MPNEKTPFKLTSSKSGSGLIPAQKKQYQRTSSGTTIRGIATQILANEMESPFYGSYESGGGGGLRGPAVTPMTPSGSAIPPALRVRLYELFVQIEKEFEMLYVENVGLQERVDWYNSEQQQHQQHVQQRSHQQQHQQQQQQQQQQRSSLKASTDHSEPVLTPTPSSASMTSLMNSMAANLPKGMSKGIYAHKIRSHTNKLRQQTNRIMSNLKGPPAISCAPFQRFTGHKDGVWEVSISKMGSPLIGTASADHTAIVWGMQSGRPLLQYKGHSGSVNSVRFHPNKELVLTSSGDSTAHIWQCAVHLFNEGTPGPGRMASSEDELGDTGECGDLAESVLLDDNKEDFLVLRTPLRSLAGHAGVVIAADWLHGGDHVVTAGWDRLACIWDTNTGQLMHQLTGHDDELTHTAAHPCSRLVVTSSKDSTFRLWDFRESIHSVSVFQGHQDTVTSAVFTREDQVVSGSDDRTVRIWDLRNMRSPLASIHADSAVNRLSISGSGLIAIPLDNRNVRLYDLNGARLGRLPRSSRQGHTRMVCSTAWSDEAKPKLFTCGFDKVILGWNVEPRESLKENENLSNTGITFSCQTSANNSGGGPLSGSGEATSKLNLGLKSSY